MGGRVCLQWFIQNVSKDHNTAHFPDQSQWVPSDFLSLVKVDRVRKALSVGHFCQQLIALSYESSIWPLCLLKDFLLSFKCSYPSTHRFAQWYCTLVFHLAFALPHISMRDRLLKLERPCDLLVTKWFYLNITPLNLSPLNKQLAIAGLHLDSMGVLKSGTIQLYKEKEVMTKNKHRKKCREIVI